jgi:hypothetical protein
MPKFCFICGAPATGVNHVPPRSFFPKQKDLPSGVAEVWHNLITVPACDDHNGSYSKDDEIASYVIFLTDKANQLGVDQFLSKGMRAINGRKGLIHSIFKKIEVYQLPDGREIPKFEFDAERVNRVMERIARGLFFYEFGRRWECALSLRADGLLMPDLSPSPNQPAIQQLNLLFKHPPRKGTNPSVFWYNWIMGVEGDCSHMLCMSFYGGLVILPSPRS